MGTSAKHLWRSFQNISLIYLVALKVGAYTLTTVRNRSKGHQAFPACWPPTEANFSYAVAIWDGMLQDSPAARHALTPCGSNKIPTPSSRWAVSSGGGSGLPECTYPQLATHQNQTTWSFVYQLQTLNISAIPSLVSSVSDQLGNQMMK